MATRKVTRQIEGTNGLRREVFAPNLGVYFDRHPLGIPERGLEDCLNIRLKEGQIRNENMGWTPFNDLNLDDNPVLLIDQFFTRSGSQILIFGTTEDLYYFHDVSATAKYITPRYEVGQASMTQDSANIIAAGGADWTDIKVGDKIWIGDSGKIDQHADWRTVTQANPAVIVMDSVWTGATGNQDYTIRKVFEGDLEDFWVTETFPDAQPADEDEWFATNGCGNSIVKWDGTDDQVTVVSGTLGFTCGWVTRYKNMMLYGDLLESGERKPQAIRNSAIAKPEDVTNDEAGEFAALDGVDRLLAIIPLADLVVVYGERSINLVQYVGEPLNFLIRTAVPGIGPLGGRAVMDFGDFHEFVASDTGYRFDGISLTEHGGQCFREVLRKIDANRLDQALAHIDEENGEVIWSVPLTTDSDPDTGGPETAFTEHYLEVVNEKDPIPMAIRDFPVTATGFYQRSTTLRFSDMTDSFASYDFRWDDRYFSAAFPQNLFGDVSGDIYEFGTVNSQNGSSITSFARFGRFPLIDGRRKAVIRRIEPGAAKRGSASYTLTTRIHGCDFADGEFAQIYEGGFDLTHASRRHMSVRKAALYGSVEFRTEGVDRPWEIVGYALESVPAGER
jgi:hypothetical protein